MTKKTTPAQRMGAFKKVTDLVKKHTQTGFVDQGNAFKGGLDRYNRIRGQKLDPSPDDIQGMEIAFPGFEKMYHDALDKSLPDNTVESLQSTLKDAIDAIREAKDERTLSLEEKLAMKDETISALKLAIETLKAK